MMYRLVLCIRVHVYNTRFVYLCIFYENEKYLSKRNDGYRTVSHIVSYISHDNPKFVYVIMSFVPFGYQPG